MPLTFASKGGTEVASRVRIATATCLVASGLLAGGAGAALALADSTLDGGDEGTGQTRDDGTRPDPQREDKDTTRTADEGGRDRHTEDDPGDDRGDKDGEPASAPTKTVEPTEIETPEPTETRTPEPTRTQDPEPPGGCEEKNDDDCEPGGRWPWWPWPAPDPGPPGDAPETGGGGVVAIQPPAGRPDPPPQMLLPPELRPPAEPAEPAGPVAAVPGAAVPGPGLPLSPIAAPVIAAPPVGVGGGSAGPATAPLPRAPRVAQAEPPAARQPPPATELGNASGPAPPYRVGYTDHLRTAGMSQLVALAAPGLTGILVLTGAGSLVGYRQAKAGHAVRTGAAARFVN